MQEAMISASSGTTTVVFRLFGDVSEERLQAETFLCQRRANQLGQPYVQPRRREPIEREPYGYDSGF